MQPPPIVGLVVTASLVAFAIWLIATATRSLRLQKKALIVIPESLDQGRESIELAKRSVEMQIEQLEITRKSLELQQKTVQLLEKIALRTGLN